MVSMKYFINIILVLFISLPAIADFKLIEEMVERHSGNAVSYAMFYAVVESFARQDKYRSFNLTKSSEALILDIEDLYNNTNGKYMFDLLIKVLPIKLRDKARQKLINSIYYESFLEDYILFIIKHWSIDSCARLLKIRHGAVAKTASLFKDFDKNKEVVRTMASRDVSLINDLKIEFNAQMNLGKEKELLEKAEKAIASEQSLRKDVKRMKENQKRENQKTTLKIIGEIVFEPINNLMAAIQNVEVGVENGTVTPDHLEGLKGTLNSMLKNLEVKYNVKLINPEQGVAFNPELHDAMTKMPGTEEGKIAQTFQAGLIYVEQTDDNEEKVTLVKAAKVVTGSDPCNPLASI